MKEKNRFINILNSIKWLGLRKFYWTIKRRKEAIEDFLLEKIFFSHKKNQSLLKRHISRVLIDIFGGDHSHNINFDQFFLGFGLIHYSIIRNIKPKSILCVGSRAGFIPAILALACRDNKMGHVDFVDAGYDENQSDVNWSGVGFWKKNNPNDHFKKLKVNNYISTYVMTTQEFAQKNKSRQYEYIYIDGDHSYSGVKLDYSLFWPKLKKNGFMAFHDIVAKGYLEKGKFGVWKFWKEIDKKNSIIFPFPNDSGLGIIQKR